VLTFSQKKTKISQKQLYWLLQNQKTTTMSKIYQLKIQLDGVSKPTVYRRVLVKPTDTLLELHKIIQGAMGWFDGHLHQFIVGRQYFGIPMPGDDWSDSEDERKYKLSQIFGDREKANIKYEYDFGDGWIHTITLEKIIASVPAETYPQLIKGQGACPPEDCGGCWGYEELKVTLADPKSEDYHEMIEMMGLEKGSEFDANEFDLKEMQEEMMSAYKNQEDYSDRYL
jgi:hypothetical protein